MKNTHPPATAPTPAIAQHDLLQGARWAHYTNIILGVWLLTSPASLGYLNADALTHVDTLRVTAERGLATPLARGVWLAWSDALSGLAVMVLAALSLNPRRLWAPWGVAVVGFWLLFAPLVLWAPHAVIYINDTLIGTLLITFAVIVPGMPGMRMLPGPELPPGWSFNPSSWTQRAPIIALALVGFFISRYLTAYQLGYIKQAWDPFFGKGTETIITSSVSRAWPVADAGVGAIAYILEVLSGFMGDQARWRSMPWMVLMFGILIIPLGVTSIVFIILQPIVIGTWCTLCLIAAFAMLIMITPSLDEVIAMFQFMRASRRRGQPFWRTFWWGGTLPDDAAPCPPRAETWYVAMLKAVGLNTVPWNLVLSVVLGVWLMAAPGLLNVQGALADSQHLVGALVVTVAMIAIGEAARPVRFINILFGAWISAAPWLLLDATRGTAWIDVAVGAALILLSLPRGRVEDRYGAWNRYVF